MDAASCVELVVEINNESHDACIVACCVRELTSRVKNGADVPDHLTELFVETEFCKQVFTRTMHPCCASSALNLLCCRASQLWVSNLDRFWRQVARKHPVSFFMSFFPALFVLTRC